MGNEEKQVKGKIVLLKGESQYNVLGYAIDLLARGFEEHGYRTVVMDVMEYPNMKVFLIAIKNELDNGGLFMFSYNAMLHEVLLENKIGLYDFLGYPCFGMLLDHPFYHKIRLACTHGDNIKIGCIDPDHVKFIHAYIKITKHAYFIPHFSFQAMDRPAFEDRKYDVYFPGSYKDPESYKQQFDELPKVFSDIAKKVSSLMLKNKAFTLEEALRRYFQSINFKYTTEDFLQIFNQIFFIDHYVRDYNRNRMIHTLLKAGINVTVNGSGWDTFKEVYGETLQVIGIGGLDIEENIKTIAEAKILLNIIPGYKNGTHERIFTAMRNGCICLTDSTGYLLDNFKDQENIVFYDVNYIEKLPDIIKDLLNHPEKAMQIAQNGFDKAEKEYDDKSLAGRILQVMGYEQ